MPPLPDPPPVPFGAIPPPPLLAPLVLVPPPVLVATPPVPAPGGFSSWGETMDASHAPIRGARAPKRTSDGRGIQASTPLTFAAAKTVLLLFRSWSLCAHGCAHRAPLLQISCRTANANSYAGAEEAHALGTQSNATLTRVPSASNGIVW